MIFIKSGNDQVAYVNDRKFQISKIANSDYCVKIYDISNKDHELAYARSSLKSLKDAKSVCERFVK